MTPKKPRIYLVLLAVSLLLLSPLFFYKLGQSSLISFDEAWYAEIAKQLLQTGTPFSLNFNSKPFVDHPPAGFWLIASTQVIFGLTEFGSRAAAAVVGLLVLVVIFIFATRLFHPTVGLASVIALSSSPWFIFRARSANLDVFLTLFYLLTLLLAVVSVKRPKYLGAFMVSLTALLLTKTASPLTIFPALAFIFWRSPVISLPKFKLFATAAGITLLSYFLIQLITVPGFLGRLLFVGAPKVGQASLLANIELVKTYLHLGIGPWFKPAIFSLPVFIFLFRSKKHLILLISLAFFLLPFSLSPKTQIWHLVPAHPLLILLLLGSLFSLLSKISHKLAIPLTLVFTLWLALPQIQKNWRDFIDIPRFISDEAILSRQAANYPEPLVIDENFVPAAVFYSGKAVSWINSEDFSALAPPGQPTLIITHAWRLDRDRVPVQDYHILAADRDRVLLLYNNARK